MNTITYHLILIVTGVVSASPAIMKEHSHHAISTTLAVKLHQNLPNLIKKKPTEAELEANDGTLSPGIVKTFMILSAVWKLMIISLIGTGLQIIIEIYILIDWLWDLFCRFLIKPILTEYGAIFFIWLFKIPTLPILLIAAFFRLFIELMGFPISGWMLFFCGNGCFLRWGNDCWFATKLSEKRYWQVGDLPIFMKQPFVNFYHVPLAGKSLSNQLKELGISRRDLLRDLSPFANAMDLILVEG